MNIIVECCANCLEKCFQSGFCLISVCSEADNFVYLYYWVKHKVVSFGEINEVKFGMAVLMVNVVFRFGARLTKQQCMLILQGGTYEVNYCLIKIKTNMSAHKSINI